MRPLADRVLTRHVLPSLGPPGAPLEHCWLLQQKPQPGSAVHALHVGPVQFCADTTAASTANNANTAMIEKILLESAQYYPLESASLKKHFCILQMSSLSSCDIAAFPMLKNLSAIFSAKLPRPTIWNRSPESALVQA